jgi:4-hydroxy-tetrahydrodipicolinate synthase
VTGIPATDALVVAVTTPVAADLSPDADLLTARCSWLIEMGCDGIALFGTTGEGAEFSPADRMTTLDRVIGSGIAPSRIVVSIGAQSIPDVVTLARQALDLNVAALLLMPPTVYRSGITEEGTFRFFASVIERIGRSDTRLLLYHFPEISGVPVTPRVVRRLDEGFPRAIAGIKDSGGDIDFTEGLIRRFSHLSVYVGSELHLPQAMASGARGTICGLGNVMPRLLRAMLDEKTAFDRRRFLPHILTGDAILSRRPFIASVKAIVAAGVGNPEWRRVLPPMAELPMVENDRLIEDFRRWEAGLPAARRSVFAHAAGDADGKVVALRRVG